MISCLTLFALKSNDLLCPASITLSLINLLKSIRPFIAFSLVFSIFFFLSFSCFFLAFSSFCSAVSEDFFYRFLVGLTNIISLSLIFFFVFIFFLSGTILGTSPSIFTFFLVLFFCFRSALIFLRQVMYLSDKLLFLL